MGSLLNHRSTRSQKSQQRSLLKEEVVRQLTVLSNQRASWRDANDEYKVLQKDDHRKILQQGDIHRLLMLNDFLFFCQSIVKLYVKKFTKGSEYLVKAAFKIIIL